MGKEQSSEVPLTVRLSSEIGLVDTFVRAGMSDLINADTFPNIHSADPDLLLLKKLDALSARVALAERQTRYFPDEDYVLQSTVSSLIEEAHTVMQAFGINEGNAPDNSRSVIAESDQKGIMSAIDLGMWSQITPINFLSLQTIPPGEVALLQARAIDVRVGQLRSLHTNGFGLNSGKDELHDQLDAHIKKLELKHTEMLKMYLESEP